MKTIIRSTLSVLICLSIPLSAFANCEAVYEQALSRRSTRHAIIVGAGVTTMFIGILATGPLGIAGAGFGVSGGGLLDWMRDHTGRLSPPLKVLTLLSASQNPESSYSIDKTGRAVALGAVGHTHFTVTVQQKSDYLNAYANRLTQQWLEQPDFCTGTPQTITPEQVSAAVRTLNANNQLCTKGQDDSVRLSTRTIESRVAAQVCLQITNPIVPSVN